MSAKPGLPLDLETFHRKQLNYLRERRQRYR
jgi:hypothetical protein